MLPSHDLESAGELVDVSAVAAEARRVLTANRQTGTSAWRDQPYSFVCPSPESYPFQWLWDSAFHAIALLAVDAELAKQELTCLLQAAQPDGFIPHMLLWDRQQHAAALRDYSIVLADPFYTATVQPPVLARAIWRVYQASAVRQTIRRPKPPSSNAARGVCWPHSKTSAGMSGSASSGTCTGTRSSAPTP